MPNGPTHRAFTLLELVIVLMLMAIVLATVAPSLTGWNRGQRLDNAAERLLAASRFARSEAISAAAPHRLEIDALGGSYRVTRLEGGGYVPVPGEFGRYAILPERIVIDIARQDLSGASVIEFHANGRLTPATVTLTADWGETLTLASTAAAESFRVMRPDGGG